MPLQYSQDDDGLLHSLDEQEQLDEICANPQAIAEQLRRIAGLMSESGGDFDAAILHAAAAHMPPGQGWQPIDTCPDEVRQALLFWPALKLDENGYTTDEPYTFTDGSRGLVGRGVREKYEGWGAWFDDDCAFGVPTHWMPLPAHPSPT